MSLEEPESEYQICSRCYNRRPKEQFLGGANKTRCIRCRMHDTRDKQRYRQRQRVKAATSPKTPPNGGKPTTLSHAEPAAEANPNVSLANRLKMILRKAMKPEELAERLCSLARSADERIASTSLETLMALQGVVVPKKAEESSDQRFFVMSATLTPKVDVELAPATPLSDNQPVAPVTAPKGASRVA